MPISSQCEAVLSALGIGLVVLDHRSRVVAVTGPCREMLGPAGDPVAGLELPGLLRRLGARCPALAALPVDTDRWPRRLEASATLAPDGGPPREATIVAARLMQDKTPWGLLALAASRQETAAPEPSALSAFCQNGQARFDALFEARGDGVLVHEPGGRFLEANQAACEMLGYSRGELQVVGPESIYLHLPPSLSLREDEPAASDVPAVLETVCVRKDGTPLPVELICRRIVHEGREAVLSLLRDLSVANRLERSLRDSQFLRDLLDALPVPLWIRRSGDGAFVLWNRGAERLSGLSREQVLGRTAEALLPPQQARAAHATDAAALLSGQTLCTPDLGACLDAGRRNAALEATVVPLYDQTGHPMAVLGVGEDGGSRSEVDRELRLEHYRELYEAVAEGVLVVDAAGHILEANAAACEALGIAPGEVEGLCLADRSWGARDAEGRPLPPDECPWKRVFVTGRPVRQALVGLGNRRNGDTRWLLVNARLLAQAKATDPVKAVVAFGDISALRRGEAELRQSHALLGQVLSSLDEAVLVIDPVNETVEDCNERTQALFGYTAGELRGMPVARLCEKSSECETDGPLSDVESHGATVVGECSMVRKDGGRFVAERLTSSIAGEDGRPRRLVTVVRDITERRRREDALRLSAIGRLSAGVAHEFNNILAGMMISAERAERKHDREEYDRLVSIVLAGARRGAEIARSLGTLAQPRDVKPEPAVIEDIIESALSLLAAQISKARVTVRRDYAPGPSRALLDAAQMEQALVAVVSNAVQAADDGGLVSIATTSQDDAEGPGTVTITVADNGTGIAPENLPRIFEPFFTTKGLLSGSPVPGMGLGLCVAHGIIQAHRGTISVNSTVGVGTEVAISLPGCDAQAPGRPASVSADGGPGSGDGRILLVEDEREIRELVRQSLREAGYEVVSAASSGPASETLRSGRFDLVITDIMMPEGGGKAVLQAAAQCAVPPPVLVITGRTEHAVIAEMMAAGARMCLSKPFGIRDLLEAVLQTIGPPPAL